MSIYFQNWERLYGYYDEYFRLIYDSYARHNITAFLVTYYSLDQDKTVWDDQNLMGGSYESIGELSGMRWKKYLLTPIYWVDEMTHSFDGQETGYLKEGETTFVLPSSFPFTPMPHDIVKFEQHYLRETNDIYPLYSVGGVEIDKNTDKRFYKLKLSVEQSRNLTEVEAQTVDVMTYLDYDKKFHTIPNATFLLNLLQKDQQLKTRLKSLYDRNSSFYLY